MNPILARALWALLTIGVSEIVKVIQKKIAERDAKAAEKEKVKATD